MVGTTPEGWHLASGTTTTPLPAMLRVPRVLSSACSGCSSRGPLLLEPLARGTPQPGRVRSRIQGASNKLGNSTLDPSIQLHFHPPRSFQLPSTQPFGSIPRPRARVARGMNIITARAQRHTAFGPAPSSSRSALPVAEAGHGSRLPRGRREREMAGHHWDRAFDAALIPAHPEALSEQFGPNKYIEATAMVAEQAQQTSAKEEWERDVRARLWAERTVAFNEISVQSEQIVEARAFMDEAAVELRTESEQLAYERAHSERWERYAETLRAQLTEAVKKEHECQQIAREEQWESYVDIVKEELEHEKKVTNEAREHDAIRRERDKLSLEILRGDAEYYGGRRRQVNAHGDPVRAPGGAGGDREVERSGCGRQGASQ